MSGDARIRRILVALDNSPGSRAAAAAAAELAALLGAELTGLFVEDSRLLRLAELEFVRELDLLTATTRRLEDPGVERQLKASAARARAALVRMAESRGTTCVFKTARGTVAREILAAARDIDLLTLGRTGWSPGHPHRLGSTVHSVLAHCQGDLLLVRETARLKPPLQVLFDASERSRDALALGAAIAGRWKAPMTVMLVGAESSTLRDEARAQLGTAAQGVALRPLGEREPHLLAHLLRLLVSGLLIVPVGRPPLTDAFLLELLEAVDYPLLALRRRIP